MKPIMTVTECVDELRLHGVPCSPTAVADAIEAGIYDFGRLKSQGKIGRRTFEIWRVDFERWLKERMGEA